MSNETLPQIEWSRLKKRSKKVKSKELRVKSKSRQ